MYEALRYTAEKALATASTAAQVIRAEAVMLRAQGWTCVDIAEELTCHADTVSRWWSTFKRENDGEVQAVRSVGRPPILGAANTQLFRSLIFLTQSYARPYRGEDLKKLLENRGISMSLSSVYVGLHAQTFSYQTPRPFNPKRSEIQVSQWKDEFPDVLDMTRKSNSEKTVSVFFQDETRYGQKGTLSKQWAPVGLRPARPRQDDFKNSYIFGAACPESGQHHFLVATDSDTEMMSIFLNNFSESLDPGLHALLVLDNAPWHKSASLKVPSNITLHFLPPYAPDLNPIENLWDFMKDNYLCNKVTRGLKELMRAGVHACRQVTTEIIQRVCARNYCTT